MLQAIDQRVERTERFVSQAARRSANDARQTAKNNIRAD